MTESTNISSSNVRESYGSDSIDVHPSGSEMNTRVVASFTCPLPPPGMLREYGEIREDLLERAVVLVERNFDMVMAQQQHRHAVELKNVEYVFKQQENNIKKERNLFCLRGRGQWLAFVLVALYFLLLGFLGYHKLETAVTAGLVSGVAALGGLVYVFIYQKRSTENGNKFTQINEQANNEH